jgi:uncharacterized membrane protein
MPHCTKCGAAVADNAAFCGNCGSAQAAPGAGAPHIASAPPSSSPAAASSQMAENVAGALSYSLGWITGLVFYFIDKRPFVKFHAAQSIVVFGALTILHEILRGFYDMSMYNGDWTNFSHGVGLFRLLHFVGLILWILLIVKAYQGERFRIPGAADLAEKIFGKS